MQGEGDGITLEKLFAIYVPQVITATPARPSLFTIVAVFAPAFTLIADGFTVIFISVSLKDCTASADVAFHRMIGSLVVPNPEP